MGFCGFYHAFLSISAVMISLSLKVGSLSKARVAVRFVGYGCTPQQLQHPRRQERISVDIGCQEREKEEKQEKEEGQERRRRRRIRRTRKRTRRRRQRKRTMEPVEKRREPQTLRAEERK